MTAPDPQREADESLANTLDGMTLAADASRWNQVQRLQRIGLVRVEVHSKHSATIWRVRHGEPPGA